MIVLRPASFKVRYMKPSCLPDRFETASSKSRAVAFDGSVIGLQGINLVARNPASNFQ